MNIYIVDDHQEFRETLRNYLTMELMHTVIGEASNGEQFLNDKKVYYADVILMDINMPKRNGISATKMGLYNNKKFKIIAVTMCCDNYGLNQIISAGFRGCICKNNIFDELDNAINKVFNGYYYFPLNMKL